MENTIYSEVANKLINKGYAVDVREFTKNGVNMVGYTVGEGSIRPTIYHDKVVAGIERDGGIASTSAIVKEIETIYNENCKPAFDVAIFQNPDFFKSNVRVCLQRVSNENIVKKDSPFANVECYLRVIFNGASFKATAQHLYILKIEESEAWEIAVRNTIGDVKIQNIGDALGFGGFFPLWVVSNSVKTYGAGAVLGITKDIVKNVIGIEADHITIIPSSVHECLVVADDSILHTDLVSMVKEVNAQEVNPIDQLADDVFTLEL